MERWEEARLRWEKTASVSGKKKIEEMEKIVSWEMSIMADTKQDDD